MAKKSCGEWGQATLYAAQIVKIVMSDPDAFAIQFNSTVKSFYQRKKAKTKIVVAIKAVAHKLCRACYYIMRDRVAFNITKAFGQK